VSQFIFILPHAFESGSSRKVNARALAALCDSLIGINLAFLADYRVPALYNAGVRYARTEEWLTTPALYQLKYGDCKSLACARIAELRHGGHAASAVFRWAPHPTKHLVYHILVQTEKGYEDPSKILGMDSKAFY
jgi:hypothetical protein